MSICSLTEEVYPYVGHAQRAAEARRAVGGSAGVAGSECEVAYIHTSESMDVAALPLVLCKTAARAFVYARRSLGHQPLLHRRS